MLTKRKLGRGKVRVTFTMPKLEGVKQLFLVGDFNNWSVASRQREKATSGSRASPALSHTDKESRQALISDILMPQPFILSPRFPDWRI